MRKMSADTNHSVKDLAPSSGEVADYNQLNTSMPINPDLSSMKEAEHLWILSLETLFGLSILGYCGNIAAFL